MPSALSLQPSDQCSQRFLPWLWSTEPHHTNAPHSPVDITDKQAVFLHALRRESRPTCVKTAMAPTLPFLISLYSGHCFSWQKSGASQALAVQTDTRNRNKARASCHAILVGLSELTPRTTKTPLLLTERQCHISSCLIIRSHSHTHIALSGMQTEDMALSLPLSQADSQTDIWQTSCSCFTCKYISSARPLWCDMSRHMYTLHTRCTQDTTCGVLSVFRVLPLLSWVAF